METERSGSEGRTFAWLLGGRHGAEAEALKDELRGALRQRQGGGWAELEAPWEEQRAWDLAATECRYATLARRNEEEWEALQADERLSLGHLGPEGYAGIRGLSAEDAERLTRTLPSTLGQAGRAGVTPASMLLLYQHARAHEGRRT